MATKASIARRRAEEKAVLNDRLESLEKEIASLKRKVSKLEKQLKEAE